MTAEHDCLTTDEVRSAWIDTAVSRHPRQEWNDRVEVEQARFDQWLADREHSATRAVPAPTSGEDRDVAGPVPSSSAPAPHTADPLPEVTERLTRVGRWLYEGHIEPRAAAQHLAAISALLSGASAPAPVTDEHVARGARAVMETRWPYRGLPADLRSAHRDHAYDYGCAVCRPDLDDGAQRLSRAVLEAALMTTTDAPKGQPTP